MNHDLKELKKGIEEMYIYYRKRSIKAEDNDGEQAFTSGALEALSSIYLFLYGGREMYNLMFNEEL